MKIYRGKKKGVKVRCFTYFSVMSAGWFVVSDVVYITWIFGYFAKNHKDNLKMLTKVRISVII